MADDEVEVEPELELDPKWVAERAAKQAAYRPPQRPKPLARWAAMIVALLVIGVVALGVGVLLAHDKPQPTPTPPNLPGVSIYIKAVGAVEVTLDGKFAGRTPLVLTLKKTAKPILIEARQIGAVKQVIPDRDQTVFLAP